MAYLGLPGAARPVWPHELAALPSRDALFKRAEPVRHLRQGQPPGSGTALADLLAQDHRARERERRKNAASTRHRRNVRTIFTVRTWKKLCYEVDHG
jgi:hypothetical protein